MTPEQIVAVRPRLVEFAGRMLGGLPRVDQRAKGELYVRGLLTDGRRKSMRPMAQRLGVDHQRLQQFITSSAARQPERELVTGESHYVWGVRRRMKVIERPGRAHFEVDAERLLLYVPARMTAERRRELLDRWYREQLRQAIPNLIAKWGPILDVSVPRWSIRRMKTKWGSCNRDTGHIWFNVELAKKHPDCLEYIVVQEMTHHLERNHGPRFIKLMDKFMPNWRAHRDQLNGAPLAQEEWPA